jgi:hypothetical protein
MAIPSRGIGWSTEDNLLWQISKQLEQLTNVTAKGCTTTTSTSSSTTTTTTTLPVYRVYTALLTQTGSSSSNAVTDLPLLPGTTYKINDNDGGTADFTNVGAPNNNPGTYFVATGTTPTSWGVNLLGQLQYDSGNIIAKVLENTIGNIWFDYRGPGSYKCVSDNLFTIDKTTVFISDTINTKSPTNIDPLQMRVLCSIVTSNQPSNLDIFTGTVTPSYEDDIISNPELQFYVTFEIRVYN